jgi:D-galactarolactone cycloisomerase
MHLSKPVELADGWERAGSVFVNPAEPKNGKFTLPTTPGLGYQFDEKEMAKRTIHLA